MTQAINPDYQAFAREQKRLKWLDETRGARFVSDIQKKLGAATRVFVGSDNRKHRITFPNAILIRAVLPDGPSGKQAGYYVDCHIGDERFHSIKVLFSELPAHDPESTGDPDGFVKLLRSKLPKGVTVRPRELNAPPTLDRDDLKMMSEPKIVVDDGRDAIGYEIVNDPDKSEAKAVQPMFAKPKPRTEPTGEAEVETDEDRVDPDLAEPEIDEQGDE